MAAGLHPALPHRSKLPDNLPRRGSPGARAKDRAALKPRKAREEVPHAGKNYREMNLNGIGGDSLGQLVTLQVAFKPCTAMTPFRYLIGTTGEEVSGGPQHSDQTCGLSLGVDDQYYFSFSAEYLHYTVTLELLVHQSTIAERRDLCAQPHSS